MTNSIFNKIKDKPLVKVIACILVVVLIIKIGALGYEFGQWLKMH
jgi:predicted ABC-type exoprotein transport system permease subunit